ncbi:MAG: AbrB/MazE/SpoVT family DNA-binding domain-containing protein [Desulfamplus sp.]|nr:AbrB/MazE/SpoVT family DNA-binding domain-containing protein [Desulfamplus sp.]
MRTKLCKIGNSRGVVIPASFLKNYNVGDEIDIRKEGGSIVIKKINTPREGWFNNYHFENDIDGWEGMVETSYDNEDWQW